MIKSIDKIKYLVFLYVVLSLTLVSCKPESHDKKVKIDFSQTNSIPSLTEARGRTTRVAVAAMTSPEENFFYYIKIFDHIAQKTGRKIAFKQRESYEEVIELLKLQELDFAFVCSGPYVEAKKDFDVEILAVPQINGKTSYQAYIVVRKESGYEKFDDLQGRKFAFTDPLSNTGCLYPKFLIKKMNQSVKDFFSDIIYTHAHDYSLQAVSNQIAEGASVSSLIFDHIQEVHPEKVAGLKVINKSEPFGMPPVVIHPKADPLLKKQIQDILLRMDSDLEGKKILSQLNIDCFLLGQDKDYDSIRAMKALISGKSGHELQSFSP